MENLIKINKKENGLKDDNPFNDTTKALYHADRISEWKKTNETFPINIEINLLDVCNQACRWCISQYSHISNPSLSKEEKTNKLSIINQNFQAPGNRKIQQGLDINYLKKFLKEIKELGTKSITYSGGGEPMIHKDAKEAITYASQIGLDVGVMTNGQFKKELIPIIGKYCKWVRVSLDTFNEKAYEYQKFTKGFKQVLSNIKDLSKEPVKLGLNINVAEWNYKEIISFGKKSKELGVDYAQARPVLMLPFEQRYNDPYRTPLNEDLLKKIISLLKKAEKLSDDNFKYLVSWDKFKKIRDFEGNFGRPYKSCEGHKFMNVLGSTGDWTTCMYHLGNPNHEYGNIYEKSAKEIWKSQKKKNVDKYCEEDLNLDKCQISCHQCNWNTMLHFIKKPEENMDVNFV